MKKFNAYVDANAERFIAELQEVCRQPSISAQNVGLEEMARIALERLTRVGAEARLIQVKGAPPVVYGEVGKGARRLMIYNHYDVQPPEPLELWESDPFDPQIRQGALYARGASDNKGNLMARLQAIEAWQTTRGELPLRVTFVVEGEEEIGSPHLGQFVAEHRELVEGADGCLWESGYKDPTGRLVITLGLKGIMYVELRARGAVRDLHSSWGTIVPNPAWRLVWALASLKDEQDHITLDGLMDHVAEPSPEEMEMLAAIPFEEEELKADYGIPGFIRNLSGLELLRKHFYGPTCTICGFETGYTGPGSKTVLPHEAMVKVDFRLVPDLTPELVMDLLRKHLDRRGFTDVEIVDLSGVRPAKPDPQAPIVRAAVEAARAVYGGEPVVYPLMAGSGPMYTLCQGLGIPAFSAGVGHAASNIHAPNENIRLTDYIEGIKYIGELIRRFGG
jgi:acetylornithine deacetylase/succinyl-diaminopimelate desuccinylase-like protein